MIPAELHEARITELEAALREIGGTAMRGGEAHYFADGTYCRALPIQKGARLVGVRHKYRHTCVLVAGRIKVLTPQGDAEIRAPKVWISEPGKKAILAFEDSILMTVHPWDGPHDPAAAEKELTE